MLDTVKLRSPYVGEDVAQAVECQLKRTSRVDLSTGEVLYAITSDLLPGSWAHEVSLRVMREEFRAEPTVGDVIRRQRRVPPSWEDSPPYLVLEGSVHKALLGHNVHGGPEDFEAPCRWLVGDVGSRLGVDLPDGGEWEVLRADWAEVYDLGSFEGVEEYLAGLSQARFPRREVGRYGAHSVHCGGFTTSVKGYHKGVEFAKHDGPRLLKWGMPEEEVEQLQHLANRLLRMEVAVKLRKLKQDRHEKVTRVHDLTPVYLGEVHDTEARRLLREGAADVQTVRTMEEVSRRLHEVHGVRRASALFGTWVKMATIGEDRTRATMTRSRFYQHRSQLQKAGCSWHLADIQLTPRLSAIPMGFSPVRTDPRRLVGEAAAVATQLEPLRLAA